MEKERKKERKKERIMEAKKYGQEIDIKPDVISSVGVMYPFESKKIIGLTKPPADKILTIN